MPKRKHPYGQTDNKKHFTHQDQGWGHIEDASEEDLMTQSSTSICSPTDNTPQLLKNVDNTDSEVEINTQSPCASHKSDADGCIDSVCLSSSPTSELLNNISGVNFTSDKESEFIIESSLNSGEYNPGNGLSNLSIDLCPSPVLINEAFHFPYQSSEHTSLKDYQMETASISSGSTSPEKGNLLKGSEWLHSVFTKMPAAAMRKQGEGCTAVERPPKECFKKLSVIKGGLAEKLENILCDHKTDAALQCGNNPSSSFENPETLQVKICDLAKFSSCHIVADCQNVVNSAESIVESNIPNGHTLAVVFPNSMVQRWTICKNCILSIVPTCQIVHVPALQKSFILCPSVVGINHSSIQYSGS